MPLSARTLALVALSIACSGLARAQMTVGDPPQPFVPARPETREELNRREAVKKFGQAVANQHESRFLKAARLFEEVTRLDPEAAPAYKALIPLYLALDRLNDALTVSKRALDLDPADHESWHLYARQLRAQNRLPEAAEALERSLGCPGLKENPELQIQSALDLAAVYETLQKPDKAEAAYVAAVKVMENPNARLGQTEIT